MMNIFQNIKSQWILRISLGIMYLYSGFNLFLYPTAWQWALPYWLRQIIMLFISVNSYLKFQGIVEIAMAALLLLWFFKPEIVRWVALLSTLEMAVIIILAFFPFSETNFLITFRDIGILGASLALFSILSDKHYYGNT